MKKKKSFKVVFVFFCFIAMAFFSLTSSRLNTTKAASDFSSEPSYVKANAVSTGMGNVETFKSYLQDTKLRNFSHKKVLQIRLGWARGLSAETTSATALLKVDKALGFISLSTLALDEGIWELWLVNNVEGSERSTMPELGDILFQVGSFSVKNGVGGLNTVVDTDYFNNFKLDRAVIVRSGQSPTQSFVLTGSPTLLERMENYPQIASFNEAEATAAMEDLIARGREIFLNETFAGNGRTCASCHREERNFTIDPKFIATLPASDPLFVAETNPDLANNFEKPDMLRKFGLFIENVDGFGDLANKFTLRASSSILAVSTSIKAPSRDNNIDFTIFADTPPLQRLGWSGDGAPGSGTLREFAIGAVTQHMPKTLNRKAGTDFRLPTDEELDALEAYQLSLGRNEDIDVLKLTIKNPTIVKGRDLFSKAEPDDGKTKKCMGCHFNGGGTTGFDLNQKICLACIPTDVNGTFDIGISDLKDAKKLSLPIDGGFGNAPVPGGGLGFCFGGLCQKLFNTPTLVEAADTGPFFHNHLIDTIEDAVAFYGTKTFDKSPTGKFKLPDGRLGQKIQLNKKESTQIAAFLRLLNILENIRSSVALQLRAGAMNSNQDIDLLIRLALAETNDALDVISNGSLAKETSLAPAVGNLTMSKSLLTNSLSSTDLATKKSLLQQASDLQRQARGGLVDVSTLPKSFQN